jgi:hypothetical protein
MVANGWGGMGGCWAPGANGWGRVRLGDRGFDCRTTVDAGLVVGVEVGSALCVVVGLEERAQFQHVGHVG